MSVKALCFALTFSSFLKNDACALDAKKIVTAVDSLESRVCDLDNENTALRDDIDSIEQYRALM